MAYLAGPFSGAIILMAERSNRYVRFHAWQAIIGLGGLTVAALTFLFLAFAGLFPAGGLHVLLLDGWTDDGALASRVGDLPGESVRRRRLETSVGGRLRRTPRALDYSIFLTFLASTLP